MANARSRRSLLAWSASFALIVALASLLVPGCQNATEISVLAQTNVRWVPDRDLSVALYFGDREDSAPVAATREPWRADGRIGTLTAVPGEDDGSGITIRVVMGIGRDPNTCRIGDASGCIISRRRLRFLPNRALRVPIMLHLECVNIGCAKDTTCNYLAKCVSSSVDAEACARGEGCNIEGDPSYDDDVPPSSNPLPPADGGAPDAADGGAGDGPTTYVGQVATVIAALPPRATSVRWEVASAPAGSRVTSSQLASETGDRIAFVPDLPGDYRFSVRFVQDGVTRAFATAAHAVDATVVYLEGETNTVSLRGIPSTGGVSELLACPFASPEAGRFEAEQAAGIGIDLWEGPPGTPTRIAATGRGSAGGNAGAVFLLDDRQRCTGNALAPAATHTGRTFQPSFRADGERIAYFSHGGGSSYVTHLYTLGFGEAIPRAITSFPPATNVVIGRSLPARPQWDADSNLTWLATAAGQTGWTLVRAPDAADATRTTLIDCATAPFTPRQFAWLDRTHIVVANGSGDAGAAAEDFLVYALPPIALDGGTTCPTPTNLTNLASGQRALDFAMPRGGDRAFYLEGANNAGPNLGVLKSFLLPTGGAAPALNGVAGFLGPRFIAGGSRLAIARSTGAFSCVSAVDPAGRNIGITDASLVDLVCETAGSPRRVAAGAGGFSTINVSSTCSQHAGSRPSSSVLILSGAALAALLVRSRRLTRGEQGIRTLEGLAPLPDFESGSFGHSDSSPPAKLPKKSASVKRKSAFLRRLFW